MTHLLKLLRKKVMEEPIELILGSSELEWKRTNCETFLYWHSYLIEVRS